ncbi:MAG: hypothetical protein HRU75_10630 [Planctomycetia bacterium]|nr:MAG: hypothetical protein HRU75_10630 [Planctomycetia bacterium]
MSQPAPNEFVKTRASIVYAHASCLCLGLALIFWGLAPAIIERIVTSRSPDWLVMTAGAASIITGALFVGLHGFIRRGARWAVWTGFVTALVLLGGWFVASMTAPDRFLSVVVPVLAGGTTVATWIALKFGAMRDATARSNPSASNPHHSAATTH